ncbi:hypothetical protein C8R44DRAFT_797976 [Mycena epipterygia]|nr:hypothetical protein C8R44DRAFT_797976 [Mycena epipterygia]
MAKQAYDWKARNCEEVANFTPAFAGKEYVQNSVGQALKDLRVREWSAWSRLDLREMLGPEREMHKQALIVNYPGLLTGPHGAIVKAKGWLPSYILSARIPHADIKLAASRTGTKLDLRIDADPDLKIALVLWQHDTGIQALSVFNNHLDSGATFSSFAVDGASTSKTNTWAVGEKGKGFILATQFFFELVDAGQSDPKAKPRHGVSFRVGHQIGTLKWKPKTARSKNDDDLVQVVLEDLTPLSTRDYLKQAAEARAAVAQRRKKNTKQEDDDSDDAGSDTSDTLPKVEDIPVTPEAFNKAQKWVQKLYRRREKLQLDTKCPKGAMDNDGRSQVHEDEVAITVLGLDSKLKLEDLFSDVYGIIPPARAWRVPGSPIQFFIADANSGGPQTKTGTAKARFHHRDQYVPHGIHLNRLSVNYHGDLHLTADRQSIVGDIKKRVYYLALGKSVDDGFRTIPALAVELAFEILTDNHTDGIAWQLDPRDNTAAEAYRKAFKAAMHRMHPELAPEADIYPTTTKNDTFFRDLGLVPVVVSSRARDIMSRSGAYLDVGDYARALLLSSPSVPTTTALERLRKAVRVLMPDVPPENVTIREYSKSEPRVGWDESKKKLAFAFPPKCADHPGDQSDRCLCWIAPTLAKAATTLCIELNRTFFSAYDAMKEDQSANSNDAGDDMDVDSLFDEAQNPGDPKPVQVSSARGTVASKPGPAEPHVSSSDARHTPIKVPGAGSVVARTPPRVPREGYRYGPLQPVARPKLSVAPPPKPAAAGATQDPAVLADLDDPVVAALSHYRELKAQLKKLQDEHKLSQIQLAEHAKLLKDGQEKAARILSLEEQLTKSRAETQKSNDQYRELKEELDEIDAVRESRRKRRMRPE